jgi:hypothetical protein
LSTIIRDCKRHGIATPLDLLEGMVIGPGAHSKRTTFPKITRARAVGRNRETAKVASWKLFADPCGLRATIPGLLR